MSAPGVTPLRVVIADDEPPARAVLRLLLAPDPDVTVVGEAADGGAARDLIRTARPDIAFLDIQMPVLDGFGVLRSLDPGVWPVIVFVTAYDAYALRAFEVHALDYLLKPFDDARFHDAVRAAKARVRAGRLADLAGAVQSLLGSLAPPVERPSRIAVRSEGRVVLVPVEEIDWVDADGDYLRIHAGRAEHVLREPLRDLELQLDPARFVRIHRSTIVNVDRIVSMEPYYRGEFVVVLKGGQRLKVSRRSRERLEQVLGGG